MELFAKRLLVQENIRISVFAVEPVFDASDAVDDPVEVGVPTKDNKRGIRSFRHHVQGSTSTSTSRVWREIGERRGSMT